MNKNFEVVLLILEDPKSLPIWLDDNRIVHEDIKVAMKYIKEQNLLSKEEFAEKAVYLRDCCLFYSSLKTMSNSGMSAQEIMNLVGKEK